MKKYNFIFYKGVGRKDKVINDINYFCHKFRFYKKHQSITSYNIDDIEYLRAYSKSLLEARMNSHPAQINITYYSAIGAGIVLFTVENYSVFKVMIAILMMLSYITMVNISRLKDISERQLLDKQLTIFLEKKKNGK